MDILRKRLYQEVINMLEYSMLYPRTTKSRRAVSMDGMWKFHLDQEEWGEEKGFAEGKWNQARFRVG